MIPEYVVEGRQGAKRIITGMLSRCIEAESPFLYARDPDGGAIIYHYSPKRGFYERMADADIDRLIRDRIHRDMGAEGFPLVTPAILRDTRTLIKSEIPDERLDNMNPMRYICFRNGVLDLTNNELIPHTPDLILTRQIACDWDPSADEPVRFLRYLRFLLTGADEDWPIAEAVQNKECELLLEYIGLIISNAPGYWPKKSLLMWGAGNTGKSQVLNLVRLLIGNDNYAAGDMATLEQRFGTSVLIGKRLYGDPDMRALKLAEVSTFKQITGGDTIRAERKGEPLFSFQYDGLLWFCSNQRPLFGGDDGAHVYGRMMLIHCQHSVPEDKRDPMLIEKLRAEAPGIIRAALKAFGRFAKRGYKFDEPDSVIQARLDYARMNNSVLSWISEECVEVPRPTLGGLRSSMSAHAVTKELTTKRLYEHYVKWCGQYAGGHPKAFHEWRETLKRQYGDECIQETKRGTMCVAIHLNHAAENDFE